MLAITAAMLVVAAFVPAAEDDGDDRHDLRLEAVEDGVFAAPPTIDRLDDGDVLVVRITGGVAQARGQVQQCRRDVSGFTGCTNQFPFQFDDDATATFQYQVVDPGGCDAAGTCVVVAGDTDSQRSAHAFTVFGTDAPQPVATLSAPGPFDPGDRVQVEVTSLPPGAAVRTAFCASECGAVSNVMAGADGTAEATVEIGDRCRNCGIVVVGGASSSLIEVSFTPAPSPQHDTPRLVAGLLLAVVFLVLAWRIVAAVDWRPPSEAQTPELDLPAPD